MKKFILIVLLLLAARPAAAVSIHELNGSDLGLGVGARSISMGGAFTGLADDASALYWNPAGITQLERSEAMIMMDNNPTRYSYKAMVFRPESWKKSKANWALGVAQTNRLKYIADGDWGQGNASHLIDLSMINVERDYVGGLNSRTTDLRVTLAGQLPTLPDLKIGVTYIDFECVTTFYGAGAGRTCQIVAYEALDVGFLYTHDPDVNYGLSLRNPFERTKPRYINIGSAWTNRNGDIITIDLERIYGQYSQEYRQVRFLMLRGGIEHDMGNGLKVRGGLVVPLKAWTSTLGNIRKNIPSPKIGATLGAGYTWHDTTLDFALYGDPGKSYVEGKKVFSTTFTLRQKF